jgi:hypothetical protein
MHVQLLTSRHYRLGERSVLSSAAVLLLLLRVALFPLELSAQTAVQQIDSEWEYIIRVADSYARGGEDRLGSMVFSAIFRNITHTSSRHRASFTYGPTGERWAGDLVRSTLLYAARDIVAQRGYWHGIDQSEITAGCSIAIASIQPNPILEALTDLTFEGIAAQVFGRRNERVTICQGLAKGKTHFDFHLEPWFNQFFRTSVNNAMLYGGDRKVELAIDILNSNCLEHDYFLRTAVAPAFNRVDQLLGENLSIFAGLLSQMQASSLRRETIHAALMGAVERGHITPQQVSRIENSTTCFRF